jgi:hypothetical protein
MAGGLAGVIIIEVKVGGVTDTLTSEQLDEAKGIESAESLIVAK